MLTTLPVPVCLAEKQTIERTRFEDSQKGQQEANEITNTGTAQGGKRGGRRKHISARIRSIRCRFQGDFLKMVRTGDVRAHE